MIFPVCPSTVQVGVFAPSIVVLVWLHVGVEEPEPEPSPEKNDVDSEIAKALICLINNDKQGFTALSHDIGVLPDALCEAINDRLYDTLGDIAVEQGDDGYSIVVDYMEEINEWLKTVKK